MAAKKPLPTDLRVLDLIYERYYDDFSSFDQEEARRKGKVHVPIDIKSIADELGVDGDIVFGRLYYHLENKHGYKRDDGTSVSLFAFEIGGERHAVNFPYLGSVLAGLREENKKFQIATIYATFSLIISLISLGVSVFV